MHNVDNLVENSPSEGQSEFFNKVKELCLFFEHNSVANKNLFNQYWEVEEFGEIKLNFEYNSKNNSVSLLNKKSQIIARYDLNKKSLYSVRDFYILNSWKEIVDFHYLNFISD